MKQKYEIIEKRRMNEWNQKKWNNWKKKNEWINGTKKMK